jgi:hypothetical protein
MRSHRSASDLAAMRVAIKSSSGKGTDPCVEVMCVAESAVDEKYWRSCHYLQLNPPSRRYHARPTFWKGGKYHIPKSRTGRTRRLVACCWASGRSSHGEAAACRIRVQSIALELPRQGCWECRAMVLAEAPRSI